MISKTDFLLYLDAPLHLWAAKHERLEQVEPSPFVQHLMEQGQEVEHLAASFLQEMLKKQGNDYQLARQKKFVDGPFQAIVDALVFDPHSNMYDVYEIKSSTGVSKQHEYDAAFQSLVCSKNVPVRHFYLVHLNNEYLRNGDVDILNLFKVECLDNAIEQLRGEVEKTRQEAWVTSGEESPEGILGCLKPKDCPCPQVCHPELPEYPIYDIPRLQKDKARQLKALNILSITDLPGDYPLSAKQREMIAVVNSGGPVINLEAIAGEFAKLEYPLHFLDYETYNPGIPWFDGYKPYQQIVFQYSLHTLKNTLDNPAHIEYLDLEEGDPGIRLVEHLQSHLAKNGSVIVWNQSFEAGRNKELAGMHPGYADFLLGINGRMFDLMTIFRNGYYLHPDFHGSASIKQVLPVLVADLSVNYEDLTVSGGDEAMMSWLEIMRGSLAQREIDQTRLDMLRYCELDTLAMVKIWEVLNQLITN
jgi:hypothetical protein